LLRRAGARFSLWALVMAVGTCGFRRIEGWPWLGSFYRTIYTVMTVGCAELHKLSRAGRIFNSRVTFLGGTTVFFAIGRIAQFAVERNWGSASGGGVRGACRRDSTTITSCGGSGRAGRRVAPEPARSRAAFVVVKSDHDRTRRALETGYRAAPGEATEHETPARSILRRPRARRPFRPTRKTSMWRSRHAMNPNLTIASRVSDDQAADKLRRAGANTVLTPCACTGRRLAQAMLRPIRPPAHPKRWSRRACRSSLA
jgi:voltage-gated potassium channel